MSTTVIPATVIHPVTYRLEITRGALPPHGWADRIIDIDEF
jgi:hypothetical protein